MNEPKTIKEVIELTLEELKKVMIPGEYAEEIGRPIAISISNLKACISAFNDAEQKKVEEEQEHAAE